MRLEAPANLLHLACLGTYGLLACASDLPKPEQASGEKAGTESAAYRLLQQLHDSASAPPDVEQVSMLHLLSDAVGVYVRGSAGGSGDQPKAEGRPTGTWEVQYDYQRGGQVTVAESVRSDAAAVDAWAYAVVKRALQRVDRSALDEVLPPLDYVASFRAALPRLHTGEPIVSANVRPTAAQRLVLEAVFRAWPEALPETQPTWQRMDQVLSVIELTESPEALAPYFPSVRPSDSTAMLLARAVSTAKTWLAFAMYLRYGADAGFLASELEVSVVRERSTALLDALVQVYAAHDGARRVIWEMQGHVANLLDDEVITGGR